MATAKKIHSDSHRHPMTLLCKEPGVGHERLCDICGHRISMGWYCRCAPCNFDTHVLCADAFTRYPNCAANNPPKMEFEHIHSQHPLTPIHQETGFKSYRVCNLCGRSITSGLYYKCAPCDFDAHRVCTFIGSLNPTKQFERIHRHQMTLLHTTNGKRTCDVCGHRISSGQYYQCAPCDFDVHFICAITCNFDPTATARSRSLEHTTSSAPAGTGSNVVKPPGKSGLEKYTTVVSAVGGTLSAGFAVVRIVDWVSKETTGKGIIAQCRAHMSSSAADAVDCGTSGDTSDGGFDADTTTPFDSGTAGDISDGGFDFGSFFDIFSSFFG